MKNFSIPSGELLSPEEFDSHVGNPMPKETHQDEKVQSNHRRQIKKRPEKGGASPSSLESALHTRCHQSNLTMKPSYQYYTPALFCA